MLRETSTQGQLDTQRREPITVARAHTRERRIPPNPHLSKTLIQRKTRKYSASLIPPKSESNPLSRL